MNLQCHCDGYRVQIQVTNLAKVENIHIDITKEKVQKILGAIAKVILITKHI